MHLRIGLKARDFRLQNRHDYIQKHGASPLLRRNLFGVGCVEVASDCQHGLAVVAIKSNRALIACSCSDWSRSNSPAHRETVLERKRLNILAYNLQVVDVLLLQRAQIWIFDLSRSEDLPQGAAAGDHKSDQYEKARLAGP